MAMTIIKLLSISIICVLVLTSCGLFESTKEKSVVLGTGGTGLKVDTAVNTSTQTVTPSVTIGQIEACLVDHKPEDGDLVYYKREKSM